MSDAATLSRLFSGIEPDLDVVDATFHERLTSGLDMLNTASAHALKSPGKRIRTALTLLSGKMLDYRFDKLLPMSVAFEMVHLATLVHDDIIDHATTRRGVPTVNARYGNGVAILLGDYLFAKTAGLIADVEDFRVDRLFSETVASVCEGTILELLTARQAEVSFEHYIERISRKTACLMSACCKGGALVCGGNDAQVNLLEQYGLNLGIAFQIIDDVLDYVGTEDVIGKPAGNDLRQGLVTLPLIYALKYQQNGHIERIEQVLRAETPPDAEVRDIVAWVAGSPAIEEAFTLARHYSVRARALLSEFPASPEHDVLENLVDFVVDRSR
jgi:geranylgeranyl pyrophosphate synthase